MYEPIDGYFTFAKAQNHTIKPDTLNQIWDNIDNSILWYAEQIDYGSVGEYFTFSKKYNHTVKPDLNDAIWLAMDTGLLDYSETVLQN